MKKFKGRNFNLKPKNNLLKYLGAFILFLIGISIINFIFNFFMNRSVYEGLEDKTKTMNKTKTTDEKKKDNTQAALDAAVLALARKTVKEGE